MHSSFLLFFRISMVVLPERTIGGSNREAQDTWYPGVFSISLSLTLTVGESKDNSNLNVLSAHFMEMEDNREWDELWKYLFSTKQNINFDFFVTFWVGKEVERDDWFLSVDCFIFLLPFWAVSCLELNFSVYCIFHSKYFVMLKIAEKIWHRIELNKMEFFVQHNFPPYNFIFGRK